MAKPSLLDRGPAVSGITNTVVLGARYPNVTLFTPISDFRLALSQGQRLARRPFGAQKPAFVEARDVYGLGRRGDHEGTTPPYYSRPPRQPAFLTQNLHQPFRLV